MSIRILSEVGTLKNKSSSGDNETRKKNRDRSSDCGFV
jgi:hypothetical protein